MPVSSLVEIARVGAGVEKSATATDVAGFKIVFLKIATKTNGGGNSGCSFEVSSPFSHYVGGKTLKYQDKTIRYIILINCSDRFEII